MTFEEFVERYNAEEEARELAAALCTVRTAHMMKIGERIWKKHFDKKKKEKHDD